ncbi:uncharacterized protein B0H64DRAFT_53336 [Chaetomium fimeti]|uniref:Uncharacterized protein n=1 Tax=Chaetomium fimeti TaxID=1854472 RepID=A0AAE0LMH3_9PEZI|nr:hypothetical protein B0H64DRAFT_53336 [Chaetomium fimeti]
MRVALGMLLGDLCYHFLPLAPPWPSGGEAFFTRPVVIRQPLMPWWITCGTCAAISTTGNRAFMAKWGLVGAARVPG